MKDTVILYGSSTGNTKDVAELIAMKMNIENVFDVAVFPAAKVEKYQKLILGSSTLGVGELQDDWVNFLPELIKQNLSGKIISIFGLGDVDCFSSSFVDAIGIIYSALKNTGAKIIGEVDVKDYNFCDSAAVVEGKFVGLPLDQDNESDKTEERIDKWINAIKPFFEQNIDKS